MPDVQVRGIARKSTRTDLAESDAGTVVRVDVGRNLEDKARELLFIRLHRTFQGLHWSWTRSYFHKAIQQFLHAKVVQCGPEEHRSQMPIQIRLMVELRIHTFQQIKVGTQLLSLLVANVLFQFLGMDVHLHFFRHHLLRRLEQIQALLIDIVNALEASPIVNRP